MDLNKPLAYRVRPKSLDEFVGQEHVVGKDKLLYRTIKADRLSSLILWGPPGCGKTSLAKVISETTKYKFTKLNAVTSGVGDIKKAIEEADNPLLIPIIQVKKKEVDIRNMEGASWRDIVAAVLETQNEAVSLEFIYQEIEPYKKTKTNQWWREKIRQTLQINPKYFQRTGRGMWKLIKEA